MANEEKKDFNAMLQDSKDMPKFQIITDQKSIEKYGGNKMYFAPPIDYDKVMKRVPYGKVITIGKIREYFARETECKISRGHRGAKRKAGSRRTYNYPEGAEEYQVLCKRLRECAF